MTFNSDTSAVSKFNSLECARSYRDRTVKASMIVLGDDGLYWVTNMALAAWLEVRGHEVVK